MNIIKLDAINSTNDYLKGLLQQQYVENLTVVSAENQLKGKGQMGSEWKVESGKNLTISILVKDLLLEVTSIFHLNVGVAVSIVETLSRHQINNLAIKWPNDILADGKKIGGILIENSIRTDGEIYSIVGIGLNVNQDFFADLPKAGSLFSVTGKMFDKDEILMTLLQNLGRNISLIMNKNTDEIWEKYHSFLFKKNIPMPFETSDGKKFMGIIQEIDSYGKLLVKMEGNSIKSFGIKELKMLY